MRPTFNMNVRRRKEEYNLQQLHLEAVGDRPILIDMRKVKTGEK